MQVEEHDTYIVLCLGILINYNGQAISTMDKPGRHPFNQMSQAFTTVEQTKSLETKSFPKWSWIPELLQWASIGISLWNYRFDLSLSCFKTLPALLLLERASDAQAWPHPTFLPSSPSTTLFPTFLTVPLTTPHPLQWPKWFHLSVTAHDPAA